MRTVYFDVENTLEVPFITGIQRVTREFSRVVMNASCQDLHHHYIPIIYDHHKHRWRRLSKAERKALLSLRPRSLTLFGRVLHKIQRLMPKPGKLYIDQFDANSVFLDIESSWHSSYQRSVLLPVLKQTETKIVKIHYDIIPLLFPDTTHPNTISVFKQHLISHLQVADLFLCISESSCRDIAQYCTQRKLKTPHMKVIHLGANIPASGNKQHATRDNAKYGRYLLAVGTIEPRKNYRLLLDAFKQIKNTSDVNLLIVGKPGWLADEIDQAIRTHPDFSTRVFLLQGISDDQLDQLYRHAWLTVIPSIYEGFGLPLVESLARNCPTISSTGGSLSEIGADLVGFFSPHSANQLSTLILELDSNPKAYEDLLNKAKNFVPPRWQDMVLEIDRHLHDLSLLELSPPERDEQGAQ